MTTMLGTLLKPDLEELIRTQDFASLRAALEDFSPPDLAEMMESFSLSDSAVVFRVLPRTVAADVFEYLPIERQTQLVQSLANEEVERLLNEMAPDDRTRLLEELPPDVTKLMLATLTPDEMRVARRLLGYPEGTAARYMTPEYLVLKPDWLVSDAMDHIRKNGKDAETLNVVYVVDEKGKLLDDLRLKTLVLAQPTARVADLNDRQLISLHADTRREDVIELFRKYDRVALPVTDSKGVLLGIITHDDVLDVAEAEATEDIQKLGGSEALDAPYLEIGLMAMVRKRGGWLSALFLGEMLTASAMSYFEHEIAKALVLALFIPLIISSGGNSGSQATSLIIRSLALREVELRDWWRVLRRESIAGLSLGALLGTIGFVRIMVWPNRAVVYGAHYGMVAATVALSLVGVVMFGSVVGAMLPFILRRLGLDPATASAPFVATLVDVTGLVIYFSIGSVLLRGILL